MTRSDILDRAKECVCGQREQDYGKPEDNFATIAELWSAYKDTDFTAEDVTMMMVLMKVARIKTGTATEDSFVDIAGYAACGGEISSMKRNDEPGIFTSIAQAVDTLGKVFANFPVNLKGTNKEDI